MKNMFHPKRVAVAISGGVDSAVAALYLKVKGFDVHGIYMKNWDTLDEIGQCTQSKDLEDAKWVCKYLEIPFHEVNFVKEYWNEVFSELIKDYETGYTPNPDIICNKSIKFDRLFEYAKTKLDVDAVATGHYARNSFGDYLEKYKPRQGARLLKSLDNFKDQTFFLSQIKQCSLQKTMFPLSNFTKSQVKDIAIRSGLGKIAQKKESTGICFIGSRNFKYFISQYIDNKPGQFIDLDTGLTIGEHQGIHHWTLGQRCCIGGQDKAYFIAKKIVKTNEIYVAKGTDHPSLFSKEIFTSKVHWIHSVPSSLQKFGIMECDFRFQHTKTLTKCKIVYVSNNMLFIKLNHPLRALTPGQLYRMGNYIFEFTHLTQTYLL